MARGRRVAPGGLVDHVLNRGVARLALFEKDADYEAFERVLAEAMQNFPTRLLSHCLMPNHWPMVIWPRKAGELTDFLRWLTHSEPSGRMALVSSVASADWKRRIAQVAF